MLHNPGSSRLSGKSSEGEKEEEGVTCKPANRLALCKWGGGVGEMN